MSSAFRRVTASSAVSWARTRHTYKLQIEGFAATILDGIPQAGASLNDGLAAVQALVAIARSVETGEHVRLDEVRGGV